MNALGKHLLLELKDCDKEILNDLDTLKSIMVTAAEKSGATIMCESFHRFNPHGISGVVIIAESHLFIHTWPEYGYAAADIFTCGTTVKPEKAADLLIRNLKAGNHSVTEMQRGILAMENSAVG